MVNELLTLLDHLSSPWILVGVRVAQISIFCVVFVDNCLFLFFWPLYCQSFSYSLSVDSRLLMNPFLVFRSNETRLCFET
jgi:hypothetical protein